MADDAALLHAFRSGDTGAGEQLLDRYFALVYRFCESRGASAGALEDAVARTFARCREQRDEPARADVRGYLLELARVELEREQHEVPAAAASTAALSTPSTSEPSEPQSDTDPEGSVFFDLLEAVARARVEASLLAGQGRRARLGSFELLRTLGHGGMGMVFEAIDRDSGEPVALKTVKRRDALSLFRLKREFRTRRQLNHPNLVGFRELYVEGPIWFFSMELIAGVDLLGHVRPRDQLLPGRLRDALAQLWQGLDALHAAGLIHNDLTPANVLVGADGRVVILDFGLSAQLTAEGAAREYVRGGTPGYVAPERLAGAEPSRASDLYALGALIHHLLTGSPPSLPVAPERLPAEASAELRALCAALLEPDPAARPGADSVRAVLCGDAQPATSWLPPPDSAVFVGRAAELARLHAAFERAASGRPAALLIGGPSGIGKSRLLEHFLARQRSRALVLAGRCSEHEQVPFKAVDGIVDALSRHLVRRPDARGLAPEDAQVLVRTFPVLSHVLATKHERGAAGTAMTELRSRAFASLKQLLFRLSRERPVIVAIDDLQWADLDSARLLADLLSPPGAPALLLIGSHRLEPDSGGAFLSELAQRVANIPGAARLDRIQLPVLDESEATALARELLAAETVHLSDAELLDTAAAVARESAGTPLLVTELVRHLRDRAHDGGDHARAVSSDAAPPRRAGAVPLSDAAPPRSAGAVPLIDASILARIARLPDDAQRLLQALCVAERPTSLAVAARAAELAHAASALQRLELDGLVRMQRRDAYQPHHDRVRELVVQRLPSEQLRAQHGRLARALQATERAAPGQLAHHYTAAGERKTAASFCVSAAERAFAQLAFHRASELFGAALRLIAAGDDRRPALELRRAEALALAGHGAAAAAGYERAAAIVPPEQARVLSRLAAAQWLRAGHKQQGLARVDRLLRDVDLAWPRTAPVVLARLIRLKLQLRLRGLAYRSRPVTDIAPSARARLETLAAVCGEVSMVDTLRGALLQTQLLLLALEQGDPLHVAQGFAWEALNTAWLGGPGQDRRACDLVARAQTLARELDSPLVTGIAKLAEAGCHLFAGRHHLVRAPALDAERIFREHCAGAWWESQLVVSMRYSTLERTGELLELAAEAPARLQDAYEKDDRFSKGQLALFAPLVHMMHDDPGAALRMLDEQRGHAHGAFDTIQLWILYRTVDANMYAGNVDAALAYLDREFARLVRSSLFRTKFVRLGAHFLHGKCSIGAAGRYPALLRAAERDARALERMGRGDADCYALVLRAGIAARANERARAAALCRDADRACRAAHIGHYATLSARNLGKVADAAHERAAGQAAEARMLAQGIENPERWAATFAPGFS